MSKTYVSLSSLTMDAGSLTKDSYAQARSTWLCTGCGVPKPDICALDVHLQEKPIDKPLSFVCGVPLIYKPFLERFPSNIVQRDLYLGRVFGPGGEQFDDWLTFRGRKRVIVRGSENVSVRKCEQCHRDVYFAMGDEYLYPEPSQEVRIFESDKFGVVVPQELYSQLDVGKWPKLRIDRLPVLDESKDGLGILANP